MSTSTHATPVKCPAHIRIGTRGSKLAVAQAMEVKNRLLGAFPKQLTQHQIEIVKIMTTGDRIQNRHLADIGGKGLFTKEIEEALFEGSIDIAVHSMKDMTDTLPKGLMIDCILEREDSRDAFLSPRYKDIKSLPSGAVVGTSSTRRQSQLLMLRQDVKVVPFRGNVITRLEKLDRGEIDATFLAVAGLKRLDLEKRITAIMTPDEMLPAVAQGAIGVECLESNVHIHQILSAINHVPSAICVKAERAFLKALEGSCTTPIAGLAEIKANGELYFKGQIASPSGKIHHTTERRGSQKDAEKMGKDAGEELRKLGGCLLMERWSMIE